MPTPTLGLLTRHRKENWVRLRTLTTLRWVAIAGQISAIVVVENVMGIDLNLWLCGAAICIAIAVNLYETFAFPANRRLSEYEVTLNLLFDITQLTFMLFATGGLHNPFSLLTLVPVVVAASVLQVGTTIGLGLLTVALITVLSAFHLPLEYVSGGTIRLSDEVLVGFWVAIVIGVVFIGSFAHRVTAEVDAMMDALTATQMALEREQRLTSLGGVVAATAHELGTPLATIKLISSEMLESAGDHENEFSEDLRLINTQANRCRDILRSMGRLGKDDSYMRRAPIAAIVREAAEPHEMRGKSVRYELHPEDDALKRQPIVIRRPEIIHGLRNVIENAVGHARKEVLVRVFWSADEIGVQISDDGSGFPQGDLDRIGEPYMGRRRVRFGLVASAPRGMGMGLFIAKTLLERTGANLTFSNGGSRSGGPVGLRGATVDVSWKAAHLEPPDPEELTVTVA